MFDKIIQYYHYVPVGREDDFGRGYGISLAMFLNAIAFLGYILVFNGANFITQNIIYLVFTYLIGFIVLFITSGLSFYEVKEHRAIAVRCILAWPLVISALITYWVVAGPVKIVAFTYNKLVDLHNNLLSLHDKF